MNIQKTNSADFVAGTTLLGAGIGWAAGAKKASNLTSDIKPEVLKNVKNMTKDEYLASRIDANLENIAKLKQSKKAKCVAEIRRKAAQDYEHVTGLLKKASKSKIKYIAILATAGLAIGTTIALLKRKETNV